MCLCGFLSLSVRPCMHTCVFVYMTKIEQYHAIKPHLTQWSNICDRFFLFFFIFEFVVWEIFLVLFSPSPLFFNILKQGSPKPRSWPSTGPQSVWNRAMEEVGECAHTAPFMQAAGAHAQPLHKWSYACSCPLLTQNHPFSPTSLQSWKGWVLKHWMCPTEIAEAVLWCYLVWVWAC